MEWWLYNHISGELITLPYNVATPVSLKILEHEIFTVTPIKILAPSFSFAQLVLIDMYNDSGAIEGLKYEAKARAKLSEVEGNGMAGEGAENLNSVVIFVQVK